MAEIALSYGEPRRGLWCPECQLPSVEELDIYFLDVDGPRRLGIRRVCTSCEERASL